MADFDKDNDNNSKEYRSNNPRKNKDTPGNNTSQNTTTNTVSDIFSPITDIVKSIGSVLKEIATTIGGFVRDFVKGIAVFITYLLYRSNFVRGFLIPSCYYGVKNFCKAIFNEWNYGRAALALIGKVTPAVKRGWHDASDVSKAEKRNYLSKIIAEYTIALSKIPADGDFNQARRAALDERKQAAENDLAAIGQGGELGRAGIIDDSRLVAVGVVAAGIATPIAAVTAGFAACVTAAAALPFLPAVGLIGGSYALFGGKNIKHAHLYGGLFKVGAILPFSNPNKDKPGAAKKVLENKNIRGILGSVGVWTGIGAILGVSLLIGGSVATAGILPATIVAVAGCYALGGAVFGFGISSLGLRGFLTAAIAPVTGFLSGMYAAGFSGFKPTKSNPDYQVINEKNLSWFARIPANIGYWITKAIFVAVRVAFDLLAGYIKGITIGLSLGFAPKFNKLLIQKILGTVCFEQASPRRGIELQFDGEQENDQQNAAPSFYEKLKSRSWFQYPTLAIFTVISIPVGIVWRIVVESINFIVGAFKGLFSKNLFAGVELAMCPFQIIPENRNLDNTRRTENDVRPVTSPSPSPSPSPYRWRKTLLGYARYFRVGKNLPIKPLSPNISGFGYVLGSYAAIITGFAAATAVAACIVGPIFGFKAGIMFGFNPKSEAAIKYYNEKLRPHKQNWFVGMTVSGYISMAVFAVTSYVTLQPLVGMVAGVVASLKAVFSPSQPVLVPVAVKLKQRTRLDTQLEEQQNSDSPATVAKSYWRLSGEKFIENKQYLGLITFGLSSLIVYPAALVLRNVFAFTRGVIKGAVLGLFWKAPNWGAQDTTSKKYSEYYHEINNPKISFVGKYSFMFTARSISFVMHAIRDTLFYAIPGGLMYGFMAGLLPNNRDYGLRSEFRKKSWPTAAIDSKSGRMTDTNAQFLLNRYKHHFMQGNYLACLGAVVAIPAWILGRGIKISVDVFRMLKNNFKAVCRNVATALIAVVVVPLVLVLKPVGRILGTLTKFTNDRRNGLTTDYRRIFKATLRVAAVIGITFAAIAAAAAFTTATAGVGPAVVAIGAVAAYYVLNYAAIKPLGGKPKRENPILTETQNKLRETNPPIYQELHGDFLNAAVGLKTGKWAVKNTGDQQTYTMRIYNPEAINDKTGLVFANRFAEFLGTKNTTREALKQAHRLLLAGKAEIVDATGGDTNFVVTNTAKWHSKQTKSLPRAIIVPTNSADKELFVELMQDRVKITIRRAQVEQFAVKQKDENRNSGSQMRRSVNGY